MIDPKFQLYDKVINPDKPDRVYIIAKVSLIDRDTPQERFVYTVTFDKADGSRGCQLNVPEKRIRLHQPKLF